MRFLGFWKPDTCPGVLPGLPAPSSQGPLWPSKLLVARPSGGVPKKHMLEALAVPFPPWVDDPASDARLAQVQATASSGVGGSRQEAGSSSHRTSQAQSGLWGPHPLGPPVPQSLILLTSQPPESQEALPSHLPERTLRPTVAAAEVDPVSQF